MTTLLNENTELEHFHFNEALFKPFENLLCLELCETDIQDQVRRKISGKCDYLIYKIFKRWIKF